MDNVLNHKGLNAIPGNWDGLSQNLNGQYGQLVFSDVTLEFVKENDILTRLVIRLNKRLSIVRNIFKN